jgi:hypothetical protein
LSKQLTKYLRSRASIFPWQVCGTGRSAFEAAVVIPALAEAQSLPQTLTSLVSNPAEILQQTLILVVVNNRLNAAVEQLLDNRKTLTWLQSNPCPQLNLAWIDASSAGVELADSEGVGLARKIGFDLSLTLLDWTQEPLLISLDADTLVDDNYLPAIFRHFQRSQTGGVTLPFRHQTGETAAEETAIRRYELYLRSYLFGLQQAASPYAFHSIGSAFACRAAAYLKAGGMNRRSAGEDFYFLQQLAKTGGVEMLSGTLVRPSARFSARVPFGTGRVVQGQVEQGAMLFRFSSVASFAVLRDWLQSVAEGWQAPAGSLMERAAEISPLLGEFLQGLDFLPNWQKLQRNHRHRQQFLAAFHCWFDGLRTRQLLSRLGNTDSEATGGDSVGRLLVWGGHPRIDDERQQLSLLQELQGAG